jgi:outer membrane protein OmpA-like peptidoglycan-associated protein
MRKVFSVVAVALVSAVLGQVAAVRAEPGPIVGTELGAMIPRGSLRSFVDTGGVISPFVGYMFNDYIGLWGHLQGWGANTQERGPSVNDNVTWVVAYTAGPRVVFPLGSVDLWATWEGGGFSGVGDNTLSHTSFGFSTGTGLEFPLTSAWHLGAYARWNMAYQEVHGTNNVKYITTGASVRYDFGIREAAPPPPPPPPPPPLAQAPPPPVKQKIVLRGVNFDFDKYAIRPDARPVLDEAIRILQEYGTVSIVCKGYTDSIGTKEYNLRLSVRRANAVRDYLVAGGISPSRIAAEGFGMADPVATNETPDGRAQNRRVELHVTGD